MDNGWPLGMNSWGSYSGDCYCAECMAAEPRIKGSRGWRRHVREVKAAKRRDETKRR